MKIIRSLIPYRIKKCRRIFISRCKQAYELLRFGPLLYVNMDQTEGNADLNIRIFAKYSESEIVTFPRNSLGTNLIHFFQERKVYSIKNAVLLAERGDVFVRNRFFAESSVWDHYAPDFMRPRPRRNVRKLDNGTYTVLQDHGYFHFLIEDLPNFLASYEALRKSRERGDVFTLTANTDTSGYFQEVTKFLDLEMIYVEANKWFNVSDLYICGRGPDSGRAHPKDIENLRKTFGSFLKYNKRNRKVYISRLNSSRSPKNEALLISVLESMNFEIVMAETLNFFEQVTLFSESKVLVGVHGAGLSNMVFMSKEASVVEIVDPTWQNLCYKFLANACGLGYHSVQSKICDNSVEIPIDDVVKEIKSLL